MKKIFSLIILGIAIASTVIAQQVPQGMKYQAVARNLKGEILANEKIVLKISLTSQEGRSATVHYSELHNIITNELGLFTLVIGEGVSNNAFKEIPWSSQNIWMEVSIADKDKGGFTVISSSKLLAVPYAFHAETADKISGKITAKPPEGGGGGGGGDDPPPTSGNSWNTQGNLATNPLTDFIGTADNKDLIFRTNNKEVMRFTADGKLITPNGVGLTLGGNLIVQGDSVDAENDLYVGRDVFLNYKGLPGTPIGSTINNGNFTVANMSSTLLTGSLTANKLIRFTDPTTSTTTANGALVVTGGTGIGENLNVGGYFNVLGNVSVNTNKFNVTAANGNTSIAGILNVANNLNVNTNKFNITASNGNTGIAGTLDVAGNFGINSNKFNVTAANGNTGIAGTLGVLGNLSVNTNKFNIDALTGNTSLAGTLGVTGITTLNNSVFANGQVRISVFLPQFTDNVYANYPLQVEGSKQGIAIKLNSSPFSNPTEQNNFISFLNSSGGFRGRIEGHPALVGTVENSIQTLVDELILSFTDAFALPNPTSSDAQAPASAAQIFTSNAAIESYERLIDFINSVVRFGINVGGAAGLCISGDCDDVIWSAVDMGVDLVKLGIFIWLENEQAGVSYESGGADYAEWLLKSDPNEPLSYGDVVGVKGGIISKNFKDADKFMVVSFAPVVIGGMPEISKENSYEKIAFMGQVMVKVMGVVKKGDYILPAGNGDGFAIAVSADKMKALDYQRVIGVSWDESDGKELFRYIKTAVGINTNDMAVMIDNMQTVMNKMQEAIKKLSPDYVPSYYSVNGSFAQTKSGYSTMPTMNEQLKTKVGSIEAGQGFTTKLQEAKNTMMAQGIDFSKYKMIENVLNNPTKENADLLVSRATLLLNHYQSILTEAQKQKGTR